MTSTNKGLVKESIDHLQLTLRKHVEAYTFIRKHKIWKGFWEYGWVARTMMVLAVLAGLKFLQIYFQWLSEAYNSDPITAISSVGGLMWEAVTEEYNFFFAGGMKYVIVIFMEIVIYHASRKTVKLLTGQDEEATFKNFMKAQVRMIKVSFQSYFMEIVFTSLIGVALSFSVFSFLGFLKPVLIFGVQCFFLGFAVMDNYVEQFEMSIKESLKVARGYFGVAIGTGLVLQIFFAIPGVGPLVGPFLSAVAVCLTMYAITDFHLRPHPTVEEVRTDGLV
jgi:CysZ protein